MRSLRAASGEMLHEWQAWLELTRRGGRPLLNFGDEASPLLLAELTGQRFRWSSLRRADVVGVGSLLQSYVRSHSRAVVFGTGTREAASLGTPRGRVLGVRGPLTALSFGVEGVALGDPGLAIAALTRPLRGPRKSTVVIPHFRAFGSRAGRAELRRLRRCGFKIVGPNAAPLSVAHDIQAADQVLTSSLHGLIFSQALHRRVQLVSFAGVAREPSFKYNDHQAVFGLPAVMEPTDRFAAPAMMPSEVSSAMDESMAIVDSELPTVLDGLYTAGARLS